MQFTGEVMKALQKLILLSLISTLVVGCSKPGDSSVEEPPVVFTYSFVAEDARIVGLEVIDDSGTRATESSPGFYEFAASYEPALPISFLSQNDADTAVTFQDLDGDGQYSSADIRYNVGFEIAYIGSFSNSGERQLFANPLTALIPSDGIPADGIAGIPEGVLQEALLVGVDNASITETVTLDDGTSVTYRQLIRRSVSVLTAIQESIVSAQGLTASSKNTAKQFLAELRKSELNTGLNDTRDLIGNSADLIDILTQDQSPVVNAVATQVGEIMATAGGNDLTFFESLVLTVQKVVSPQVAASEVTSTLTLDATQATDNGVELAINLVEEIEQAGGLETFLASLVAVPIDIAPNGRSLVDNMVTDFNLELMADTGVVKLNATNAFFDQANFDYFFAQDVYAVKVDDNHAVMMVLNANATNWLGAAARDEGAARLLALCWNEIEQNEQSDDVCGANNINLEYYALATVAEICQADFDEILLAEINSLNRLQISCN